VANLAFSLFAAVAALTVGVLSMVKGAWVVGGIFTLLAAGFLLRAGERYWRRSR
jgi:membrane protein implicated in regulation of membrane protease activity